MSHRSGFTLVELSIVLVVIGLIVGGVLVGKDLIKAAEIRAAVTQLQQYSEGYHTFKLKYGCAMGDCPNATDFFGAGYVSSSTFPACASATNGIGNGNGNGFIDDGGGGSSYCESVFAISALRLANFLPTTLLNLCTSANPYMFNGINNGCGYFLTDDLYGAVPQKSLDTLTWTVTGASTGASANYPTISPVQAKGIDDKIDDGIPNKGNFYGIDTASQAVGTGVSIPNSCQTSGVYNTNETMTCRTVYYLK